MPVNRKIAFERSHSTEQTYPLGSVLLQLLLKFEQHLGTKTYPGHFSTMQPSSGSEPLA